MNYKKILIYAGLAFHGLVLMYFWVLGPGSRVFVNTTASLLSLGDLAGLILASMALLQLLLMSRAPLIEQTWGLDKLTRLHSLLGKLFLIFLVLHPALITFSYSRSSGLPPLAQYFDLLHLEDITNAVVAFWLFIALIIYSILRAYKRLNFEKWYLSHLLMYGGTLLAFGHQQELGNTLNSDSLFSFYWLAVFAATFLTLGVFRFLLPLYYFYQHQFFVQKITQETPNVWSIFIGGKNLQNLKIRGGQFFITRFFAKGYFMEAHPFSLSQEPNPDSLRLTIKASGDFTAKIAQIPLGTKVYLEGPYGIFTADKANAEKVLLLAGGIGITPIRAMLEDLGQANKDIVLVYGNKKPQDIALKSELEELAEKYNIQIHHVLSNPAETANPKSEAPNTTCPPKPQIGRRWKQNPNSNSQNSKPDIHYGFITGDLVARFAPDYLEREIFICGPPPMMDGLIASLKKQGLPTNHLHFEKFSF